MVSGLDGPGLAQLAGLTTKDMASIMGQRAQRQGMEQQKHRDLVNEMYMESQMEKMQAETERMRRNTPHKFPDGSTRLVSMPDKLKLEQLRISEMANLEKDMKYMRGSDRYTEEQIEDYRLSKMGDIGEYEKAVSQGYGKNFDEFQKELGASRSIKLSIGEKAEIAGKTTTARKRAEMKEYLLGPKVLDDARTQAMKEIKDSPSVDWIDASPGEVEKALEDKMYKIITKKLEAFSEFKKVEPGRNNGKLGWIITDKDDEEIWRSF